MLLSDRVRNRKRRERIGKELITVSDHPFESFSGEVESKKDTWPCKIKFVRLPGQPTRHTSLLAFALSVLGQLLFGALLKLQYILWFMASARQPFALVWGSIVEITRAGQHFLQQKAIDAVET